MHSLGNDRVVGDKMAELLLNNVREQFNNRLFDQMSSNAYYRLHDNTRLPLFEQLFDGLGNQVYVRLREQLGGVA
jgi:hypothetical protein